MFFFFYFDNYKKVDERIEANGGEEAVGILKKRMDFLGLKNADVAALLDENKSGASRYFNRNMNITAERTQRTARALGGVIRVEGQDTDDEDEFLFRQYAESSMGRWMPAEYQAKTIYGDAIILEAEKDVLYPSLKMAFDKYSTLLHKLTGTATVRGTNEIAIETDVETMSAEIREAVIGERKAACEVNPAHELFEGSDGKPYVEVVPFVPINGRSIPMYGQKLVSKANAVMLCPMCRAKLEHGSQSIREDIILKLYDKRIEEMKTAGLDITRTEILFTRFMDNDFSQSRWSVTRRHHD